MCHIQEKRLKQLKNTACRPFIFYISEYPATKNDQIVAILQCKTFSVHICETIKVVVEPMKHFYLKSSSNDKPKC